MNDVKKPIVFLYWNYRYLFAGLTNEEKGKVLTAIFEMDERDGTEGLSEFAKGIFLFIRGQILRDRSKYESVCERNRAAATEREETEATKTTEREETETEATATTATEATATTEAPKTTATTETEATATTETEATATTETEATATTETEAPKTTATEAPARPLRDGKAAAQIESAPEPSGEANQPTVYHEKEKGKDKEKEREKEKENKKENINENENVNEKENEKEIRGHETSPRNGQALCDAPTDSETSPFRGANTPQSEGIYNGFIGNGKPADRGKDLACSQFTVFPLLVFGCHANGKLSSERIGSAPTVYGRSPPDCLRAFASCQIRETRRESARHKPSFCPRADHKKGRVSPRSVYKSFDEGRVSARFAVTDEVDEN